MERLTSNIVGPDGPLDAKICFIGEAPGSEENDSLKPFVGAAGGTLNRGFRTTGISRPEVLVANVFKQRPPGNDVGYYFQDRGHKKLTWEGQEHVDQLSKWLRELRQQENGGPNVLVALGATAMYILTGESRITKFRGSVLPCILVEGYKVYCMFHPSYVMRLMNEPEERLFGDKKAQQQNALPLFLKDLERAQIQGETKEYKRPERVFETNLGLWAILGVLNELRNNPTMNVVSVDIETLRSSNGPLVWCIGFSPYPEYAFVIPFLRNGKFVWSIEEEARILRAISEVFLDEKIKKIFHNNLFDLSVLGRYYGLRCKSGSVEDTMFCFHATYPYLRKALNVLTSIYTWEPYYKDDGKVWEGKRISDDAEFIYNARDCCVTREIWPQVERDAKEKGTWSGYRRSMDIMPSLLRMQIRGVKINQVKKESLGVEFKNLADRAEKEIELETDQRVNIGSSNQVNRLLYGYMNLPIQYHLKTGKPTTDKDAVNRLLKKYPNPESQEHIVLSKLSNYRKFSKLAETYTEMEVENDGRVRTSYTFISTFRLSSSESLFGGGGNLQNIPTRTEEGKHIRRLFIPDEGFVFLASDLSQAEARVVAWLSGDSRLIELFEEGLDVHWENGKIIFSLPKDLVYEANEEIFSSLVSEAHPMKFFRQLAKTIVHATNYKMGPRMLQTILIREEVFFPEALCRQLLYTYRQNNPFLEKWHGEVMEQIRATRTLTTPLGRKREFRGRLNDNLFRSAIAFNPQSTVGEILELAIEDIHEDLDYIEPLMNVHDEVVSQLEEENILRGIIDIRKRMERPLEIRGRVLTIPCDFKVGINWGDMEEIKEEANENN